MIKHVKEHAAGSGVWTNNLECSLGPDPSKEADRLTSSMRVKHYGIIRLDYLIFILMGWFDLAWFGLLFCPARWIKTNGA